MKDNNNSNPSWEEVKGYLRYLLKNNSKLRYSGITKIQGVELI